MKTKNHKCGECRHIVKWEAHGEAECPILAAFTLPNDMSAIRSKRQNACQHFSPKEEKKD